MIDHQLLPLRFLRSLCPALLGLALPLQVAAATPSSAGEHARSLLVHGERDTARAAYAKLFRSDPRVALHDLIRDAFLQENFTEALRLCHLADRLDVALPHLRYYWRLAATLAGACPLALRPADKSQWDELIIAYAFRNYRKFSQSAAVVSPVSPVGKRTTSLSSGQTAYLHEIETLDPVRGGGCDAAMEFVEDRDEAKRLELDHLMLFLRDVYSDARAPRLAGLDKVLMRSVVLAAELKSKSDATFLASLYRDITADDWIEMHEHERRTLWQVLTDGKRLPKPPIAIDHPAITTVLRIVKSLKDPDATTWLGLFNADDLPSETRYQLWQHLLAIPSLPQRPDIVVRLAELEILRGNFPEGLRHLRALLLDGLADGSGDVQQYAINLAVQVFQNFRYDQSMLGAIEGAIPRSLWQQVFSRLLIQHALDGDQAKFRSLRQWIISVSYSGHSHRIPREY